MKQRCPKCNNLGQMTRDHIIPDWFASRISLFEIDLSIEGNRQALCKQCNTDKAGKINYEDENVKAFMKEFVKQLGAKLV